MSEIKWSIDTQVQVVNLLASFDQDGAGTKDSAEFDVRTYPRGSRFLLAMDIAGAAGNTGGTWSVGESATTGGGVTAATTHGSLTATGASTTLVQRKAALHPNPLKPFVRVKFTDTDAATDGLLSVTLLVLPQSV